jgi:anti-sigma regulatory factor (Ser/Thr protein kinase)
VTAPLLTLEIHFENDLVSVRQHARQISSLLGFDEMDQARISTAVSEIARNALGYARGGTAEFLVKGVETPELLISVSDRGPRKEAVAALRAALAKAEAASRPSQTEEARNVY